MILISSKRQRQRIDPLVEEEAKIKEFMLSHDITLEEARKIFETKQRSLRDF